MPHLLYWKFSRDGARSTTYISFIFDVPMTQIQEKPSFIWNASFGQLKTIMLLLQDVELLNKKRLAKDAFVEAVQKCGYTARPDANEIREEKGLVAGCAVIGRHNGSPIPYGFWSEENSSQTIAVDASSFTPALLIRGDSGRIIKSIGGPRNSGSDLLNHYRAIDGFDTRCNYWDLMPKHSHMNEICSAMKSLDETGTELFLTQTLNWRKTNG